MDPAAAHAHAHSHAHHAQQHIEMKNHIMQRRHYGSDDLPASYTNRDEPVGILPTNVYPHAAFISHRTHHHHHANIFTPSVAPPPPPPRIEPFSSSERPRGKRIVPCTELIKRRERDALPPPPPPPLPPRPPAVFDVLPPPPPRAAPSAEVLFPWPHLARRSEQSLKGRTTTAIEYTPDFHKLGTTVPVGMNSVAVRSILDYRPKNIKAALLSAHLWSQVSHTRVKTSKNYKEALKLKQLNDERKEVEMLPETVVHVEEKKEEVKIEPEVVDKKSKRASKKTTAK